MTCAEQLEHAFAEIAALNKALTECEAARDALREALCALIRSNRAAASAMDEPIRVAMRALEPHPPAPESEASK